MKKAEEIDCLVWRKRLADIRWGSLAVHFNFTNDEARAFLDTWIALDTLKRSIEGDDD